MKNRYSFKLFGWEVVIVKIKQKRVAPLTKTKKKRLEKSGLGWCEVVQKVQYPEALAKLKAQQLKKSSQNNLYLRAYKCEFCSEWHLTHKKSYLKMNNR